jgi:hypothetical protein
VPTAQGKIYLFEFYHNAAELNLDLRPWMTALNYFTLPLSLIIVLRFFKGALVLQNDLLFSPPGK